MPHGAVIYSMLQNNLPNALPMDCMIVYYLDTLFCVNEGAIFTPLLTISQHIFIVLCFCDLIILSLYLLQEMYKSKDDPNYVSPH